MDTPKIYPEITKEIIGRINTDPVVPNDVPINVHVCQPNNSDFEVKLKLKLITIISYILFSYIICFIIYGAYEFTYNFNLTADNVKLTYDIRSSNRNNAINNLNSEFESDFKRYRTCMLSLYILYITLLSNLIIVSRLYIHKLKNGGERCLVIFKLMLIFTASGYVALFLPTGIISEISVSQLAKNENGLYSSGYDSISSPTNFMLCGPLDMIVFSFLVFLSFVGPPMLFAIFICIGCTCVNSIKACKDDGII